MTQREISDLCQVFRIQFHVRSVPHRPACTRIGSPQRGRDIIAGQMRLVEAPLNVRFESKADICSAPGQVRFGVTADIAASATHRKAKLILPIIQIATAATSPALTNTPDTTAALNRITPNAYAILSSAHRITLMKRPNTQ